MALEFDETTTIVLFLAIVALGTVALLGAPMGMTTQTVLMMVTPSLIVYGLVMLGIGIKHGEYRS
jgi:hypothetical protein